ncbi:MAG: DUF4149 domain-containing protein [Leptolyngbyaceae cyanobacterium SM1_1_3]|nr:DUF4149 domain-containing protein [Leptolyngbyaceae cyanobacterium SM1_1_3]NJO09165.1 DUF4149 domain-containing protein [Leptolyngbyaceae cyanobacterium SL_1_1]
MHVASKNISRSVDWQVIVFAMLGFWLSASLVLDFVIMPSMYGAGMMNQPDFGSMGYGLFWIFNRIEVLCAAGILTGLLVLRQGQNQFSLLNNGSQSRWSLLLAGLLLAIAMAYTYFLAPEMSALSLSDALQPAATAPAEMNQLHGLYWLLESLKLAAAALLLRFCYRDVAAVGNTH